MWHQRYFHKIMNIVFAQNIIAKNGNNNNLILRHIYIFNCYHCEGIQPFIIGTITINYAKLLYRASWTKIGNSSKNLTFSDFHDFFTPIYSADFCETFFHGSPTPYERTQGVSYLQIETNRK